MGITLTAVGDGTILPRAESDSPPDPPARVADSIKAQRTIAAIERDLGGRDVILAELLRSPKLDPPIRALLDLLYDPRFDKQPLPVLCERIGITPGDLFAAFRDATIATAHIHAVRLIAARFPQVVTALVDSATDHQEVCPTCRGTRTVRVLKPKKDRTDTDKYEIEPCSACAETGHVLVKANPDQQERVLEVMGMLKQGVGLQVNHTSTTINQTQNNLGVTGSGASLFDLQKAVGAVLHRQALRLVPKAESSPTPTDDPAAPPSPPIEGEVL